MRVRQYAATANEIRAFMLWLKARRFTHTYIPTPMKILNTEPPRHPAIAMLG